MLYIFLNVEVLFYKYVGSIKAKLFTTFLIILNFYSTCKDFLSRDSCV